MDWKDSPEQAAFRAEVRTLIDDRLPARYKQMAAAGGPGERAWEFDRKSPDPEVRKAATDWHAALNERKWVAPHTSRHVLPAWHGPAPGPQSSAQSFRSPSGYTPRACSLSCGTACHAYATAPGSSPTPRRRPC